MMEAYANILTRKKPKIERWRGETIFIWIAFKIFVFFLFVFCFALVENVFIFAWYFRINEYNLCVYLYRCHIGKLEENG